MQRFFGQYIHYFALLLAIGILAWNNVEIHYHVNTPANWIQDGTLVQPTFSPNTWTLDDAYISMRYAENFANGHGIRFNPGEKPVEGYTTFLWVFLMGIGHVLGAPLPILAKALGAAFTLGTLLLLTFTHRFIPGASPRISALAVLMLGSSGMFSLWSLSSMEVPMVAFWTVLAVFLHLNSREKPYSLIRITLTALACALVALSRPEMIIIFLLCFLERFYCSVKDRDLNFFYFGLLFTTFFLPFLVWRFWYYGYWVPNTFYAKVGENYLIQAQRGLGYLANFVNAAFLILAPAITGFFMSDALRQRFISVGILGTIILVDMAYVITVGGDIMPASRFLVPFLPLLCILAALTLGLLVRPAPRITLVILLIITYNQFQFYNAPDQKQRTDKGSVGRHGELVGRWMKDNFPEDALLATNTAGSIPFYSKLKCIDMLGLNDEHIAHRDIKSVGTGHLGHEKGDGKYVLDQKPDYIQFGSASGAINPGSFRGDREIYRDPRFKKYYTLKNYTIPGGRRLAIYERNPEGIINIEPVPAKPGKKKPRPNSKPEATE